VEGSGFSRVVLAGSASLAIHALVGVAVWVAPPISPEEAGTRRVVSLLPMTLDRPATKPPEAAPPPPATPPQARPEPRLEVVPKPPEPEIIPPPEPPRVRVGDEPGPTDSKNPISSRIEGEHQTRLGEQDQPALSQNAGAGVPATVRSGPASRAAPNALPPVPQDAPAPTPVAPPPTPTQAAVRPAEAKIPEENPTPLDDPKVTITSAPKADDLRPVPKELASPSSGPTADRPTSEPVDAPKPDASRPTQLPKGPPIPPDVQPKPGPRDPVLEIGPLPTPPTPEGVPIGPDPRAGPRDVPEPPRLPTDAPRPASAPEPAPPGAGLPVLPPTPRVGPDQNEIKPAPMVAPVPAAPPEPTAPPEPKDAARLDPTVSPGLTALGESLLRLNPQPLELALNLASVPLGPLRLRATTPVSPPSLPAPEPRATPRSQASATPRPPSPPGAVSDAGDPGVQANKDSDGFSTRMTGQYLNGRVVGAHGLDVRTKRPEFTRLVRATAAPTRVVVEIAFVRDGTVKEARMVQPAGNPDIDEPIKNAVYAWTASGRPLDELPPGENSRLLLTVTMNLR
jgi:hypothetical protein